MKRYIKSVDSYAVPVSLTYKGESTIGSVLGGTITLISWALIGAFFVYLCLGVVQQQYNLITSQINYDLSVDQTFYTLNIGNFDFAIRLDYNFKAWEPEVIQNFDTYIDFMIS